MIEPYVTKLTKGMGDRGSGGGGVTSQHQQSVPCHQIHRRHAGTQQEQHMLESTSIGG
jgi:hypothetical protein